jgi:heterodisulfide reductase subunit C
MERKVSAVKSFPKPHREKLEGDGYREFIRSIFERDGWQCRKCGERSSLTPHHIIKRSQLGGDTPRNVLTLCLDCHEAVERNELKIEVVDVVVRFKRSGVDR